MKIKNFSTIPLVDKISMLKNAYYYFKSLLVYKFMFKNIGKGSIIIKPLKFTNPQNIIIEDNVRINDFVWLITIKNNANTPIIVIGNNTNIGHFNHIACTNKICIGSNVLTADKVYITDHIHDYKDITVPIIEQPIISKREVNIGNGTWIGENVSIIGCSIGENCVIGANSVVTKDIPDYCVAVGAPARIIKRYDKEQKKWLKYN